MQAKSPLVVLLAGMFGAASPTYAQQPAISMSRDASGKTRTFLASQISVSKGFADMFSAVDNDVFTCTLARPLKEGDVIASMASEDQVWSISKVPLLVGTNNDAQYPIMAELKGSDGEMRGLSPAVLKAKIDIKAGDVLHSNGYDIEAKRSIKAGDSIPVLYIQGGHGQWFLSVESAGATGPSVLGSPGSMTESQPLFTAISISGGAKPDNRRATIEAWRIEKDHVK